MLRAHRARRRFGRGRDPVVRRPVQATTTVSVKIRLDWEKRYITLAAISTVLGLAFKLEDPDEILGKGKRLGITCALVPTTTPGVELGERHDPLGVPFYNCPTRGRERRRSRSTRSSAVRPAVGHGWRMLMECLAAGRGISLPATSTGGAKLVARDGRRTTPRSASSSASRSVASKASRNRSRASPA